METVNLDRYTMPGNFFGRLRAMNYMNAWPGAAGEIEVSLCFQRDEVVQFGRPLSDPAATFWRRSKSRHSTGGWSDWKEDMGQGGVSNGNNAKVSRCAFEDGNVTVFLPGWHKVPVIQCDGDVLHSMGDGGCHVISSGITEYETTGMVQQVYDQYVCFGVSRNGGPVQEVGRQRIKANGDNFVYYRAQFYSEVDTFLEFWISSTFQYAATVWSQTRMLVVQG